MVFKIRKMRSQDIEKILSFMKSLYHRWDRIDPIDKIDSSWFSSAQGPIYLENIMHDRRKQFLVAVDDENILGYLLAEIDNRKPFLRPVGYIEETFTSSNCRKKGVALALYGSAVDWFKKKKVAWFTVSTHSLDTSAISFWKKRGFMEYNKVFKLKSN